MSKPARTFVIETPEQLRAAADPTRQRLLAAFAEPRTVKQAAEHLGEPVTKLYHHVDLLTAASLIQVVSEERRRATIERTFRANGNRFVVSPAALGQIEPSAGREAVARTALNDMLDAAADRQGSFRLLRLTARLSEEGLGRLEAELGRLVRELDDGNGPCVELMLLSSARE